MQTPVETAPWPLATAPNAEDRLPSGPRGQGAERALRLLRSELPAIVVDDPVRTPSAEAVRRGAGLLDGSIDAVHVAEHDDRRGLTAVLRAASYVDRGVDVWCRVACHDRNRVAVEGDLAALADLDVAGVLVDPRPAGGLADLGPDDCLRLAGYAGHLTAVRVEDDRAVDVWHRSGAEVAFVADAGSWSPVATGLVALTAVALVLAPGRVGDGVAHAADRAAALLDRADVGGIWLRPQGGAPEHEVATALARAATRIRP